MAAKRLAFRLSGLTSNGTPRKSKIWPKHLFFGCVNETAKNKIRRRVNRAQNIASGLRHDGKSRKTYSWPELDGLSGRARKLRRQTLTMRRHYAEKRQTTIDRAWQSFRAAIVMPTFAE